MCSPRTTIMLPSVSELQSLTVRVCVASCMRTPKRLIVSLVSTVRLSEVRKKVLRLEEELGRRPLQALAELVHRVRDVGSSGRGRVHEAADTLLERGEDIRVAPPPPTTTMTMANAASTRTTRTTCVVCRLPPMPISLTSFQA